MKTTTLFKAGHVAILAMIFTASNILLVEASHSDFGHAKRGASTSKKYIHHVSDAQVRGRASDNTPFKIIDGEPLNSMD